MAEQHEFDVLLFDNDGTLTDSTPAVFAAWLKFGTEYGFDGKEAAEATHGMRLVDSLRKWCKLEDHDAIVAAVKRFEADVIELAPVPLPGVGTLVQQLRKNSPTTHAGWAVCTSGEAIISQNALRAELAGATRWYATQVLQRVGVGIPEVLVTSEDVQRGKPHPDPYLEGAKRCQASDPSRVLVFEDAVSGIASGKAAGMKTLAVCTTTPREALHALDPDWIVPDLTHVSIEWKDGKAIVTIQP